MAAMIKKILFLFTLIVSGSYVSHAQTNLYPYNDWCQTGGKNVLTSNLKSSNLFQESYPNCTITVYFSGTTTKASIYSDAIGTVKPNPFTALDDGTFNFYAAGGVFYDIVASGSGMTTRTIKICISCGGEGSIGYPPPGIGNSSGSSWLPSYNSSNKIPANYISQLNQDTTGNAATATNFDHTPTPCNSGEFAGGINQHGDSINCGEGNVTPGGTFYEVQTNLNNTSLDGSNLFTNAAHTSNLNHATFTQFAKNPLYGSVPLCTTSLSDPNQPTASWWSCGAVSNYTLTSVENPITGQWPRNNGQLDNYFYLGVGQMDVNNQETAGATVHPANVSTVLDLEPGISNYQTITNYCYHSGDCQNIYSYNWTQGGAGFAGDEGQNNINLNSFMTIANGNVFTATITNAVTSGSTTFNFNTFTSFPPIGYGFYAIDLTSGPISTGTACAQSGVNITACDAGTFIPAFAIGTNDGAINITSGQDVLSGNSVTFTMSWLQGTGATGFVPGPFIVACPSGGGASISPDFGTITSATAKDGSNKQTITATFWHGHQAGCKFSQGGTHGILDLVRNRQSSNPKFKTGIYVYAASDDTHIESANMIGSARFSQPIFYGFERGPNTNVVNATRVGGTVTATFGGNAWIYTGTPITVTSAADPSFDGSFVAGSTIIGSTGTVQWTQSGPDTGNVSITVSNGGNIGGQDSPSAFQVWNATQTHSVIPRTGNIPSPTIETNACCSGLVLMPNDIAWNTGDEIDVMPSVNLQLDPMSIRGVMDIPNTTTGPNPWLRMSFNGQGVNDDFQAIAAVNTTPLTNYIGVGTGKIAGPTGFFLDGAYSNGLVLRAGLLPNGSGLAILPPRYPNLLTTPNAINTLNVSNSGGGAGQILSYDYTSGTSNLSSGATGARSVIQFGPTGITLAPAGNVLNFSVPTRLATDTTRPLVAVGGIIKQGPAIIHASGSGCTISAGTIGTTCNALVLYDSPMPTGSSPIVSGCTISGSTGPNYAANVSGYSGTGFTIQEVAGSITAAGGGTISCMVSGVN